MTDVTLADFLLARIAEDEADAVAADRGVPWWPYERPSCSGVWASREQGGRGYRVATLPRANERDHIARHDPARVLAECEAKRRIVALADGEARSAAASDDEFGDHRGCLYDTANAMRETLRLLALPYADHPDFDESWRV